MRDILGRRVAQGKACDIEVIKTSVGYDTHSLMSTM